RRTAVPAAGAGTAVARRAARLRIPTGQGRVGLPLRGPLRVRGRRPEHRHLLRPALTSEPAAPWRPTPAARSWASRHHRRPIPTLDEAKSWWGGSVGHWF